MIRVRAACAVFLLSAALSLALLAAAASAIDSPDRDTAALSEATRLLEDELKLAARPQIYLVLNLAERHIAIKGRGLELHRIPIADWTRSGNHPLTSIFRLRTRPAVDRPKAATVENAPVSAIELHNMPDTYELHFDPGLVILVTQSWRDRPWERMKALLRAWWQQARTAASAANDQPAVRLHLVLTQEAAQSLAWSAVDGMPLLLGPAP